MADYYLKIDGVAGESLDERHRDEIEVLAFSWGESHPVRPPPARPSVSARSASSRSTSPPTSARRRQSCCCWAPTGSPRGTRSSWHVERVRRNTSTSR